MPKKRRNPRGHQPPKRFTNPPAVSKVLQKSHLDITKWEVEKLNYNLDIQAIPYNSRLSHLLPGYIPTLTALEEIALTSAFVAFDTESVPHCYKTTDVGFALLPILDRTQPSRKGGPTLEEFVKDHQVEVASFKVNGRYHDVDARLKSMVPHVPGLPYRPMEPLRFGKEHFVDIDELDAELKKQIEQFRQVVPNKQLILVGLSLQSDFERMSLDFPGIIELFSGWVDLSTLMKAQSLAPAKLDTGLGTALKAFRYPYSDTGFNCRHQAANDAVRTLAALHGLMDPQNVASILLRQREFPGIEIAAGVDHFASKVYRALLHVDGKELPPSIDSAQKLALAVQNFKPIGVAADCSNAKNGAKKRHPTSIHTVNRTCGCVCFKSNKALQHFIRVMNGQRYGNVALKAARAPLPQKIQTQISNGKKLNAQRKNRRKQLTRNTDWSGSFRNTFLVHDVTADEEVKQEIAVVETITPYQHQNELPARADGDKEADAEDHVNEVVKEPLDDGTEGVTETAPHTASVVDQVVSFEVEVESQEVSNAAEAETNTEDISTDQHHPDEENAKDTKHLRYSCEESDPVPAHETEVTRNSNKRQRLWPFKHSNSYPKQTRHNGLILDYGTSVPGEKRPSWLSRFRRKVLHIK